MKLHQRRGREVLEGSSPMGGQAPEQAFQNHGPKLPEFKEHLDNALSNMV